MIGWLFGRQADPSNVTGAPRSPQWPKVRAEHLKANPACAACGGRDSLEVHHIHGFAERPDLELDPRNLLTLCASDCHLVFGHLHAWTRINPDVIADVRSYRTKVEAAKRAGRTPSAGA